MVYTKSKRVETPYVYIFLCIYAYYWTLSKITNASPKLDKKIPNFIFTLQYVIMIGFGWKTRKENVKM